MLDYADSQRVRLVNASIEHARQKNNALVIHDNAQLKRFIEAAQESTKWKNIRVALDALLSASIAYLADSSGQAPRSFPLFSYAGYNKNQLPNVIRIKQDKIQSKEMAEFLHLFKRISPSGQHEIEFVYQSRESSLETLSQVQSLCTLVESFGSREHIVNLKEPDAQFNQDHISNLMTENHQAGLSALPTINMDYASCVLAVKHQKHSDHPSNTEKKIKKLISDLQYRQFGSNKEEAKFLSTVIISLKLDLAYVMDRTASQEVIEAMALARHLDDPILVADCQRFANQCLDMSDEALTMLESACNTLRKFPEFTDQSGHILPKLFGCISNRNTTKLTRHKSYIDAHQMENDFWEAKSRLPSYHNLALLGNGSAVAYLIQGKYYDAVRMLQASVGENVETTERLNIYCNLLLAQYLESGDYSELVFRRLVDRLSEFDMGMHWEYLKVRILLNLMQISKKKEHFEL